MGEIREWEIWIGDYDLGQGYERPTKPCMVGKESAIDFTIACLKYELKSMLSSIEKQQVNNGYVPFQSREWYFDWRSNSNSWTGRYFDNEADARKSFG